MASNKDFLEYVLELLREVNGITYRYMMSEYILYKDGVVFGGIYDNRFLVKETPSLKKHHFKEALPYPGGSMMYIIDIEDSEEIALIVNKVISDLKGHHQ